MNFKTEWIDKFRQLFSIVIGKVYGYGANSVRINRKTITHRLRVVNLKISLIYSLQPAKFNFILFWKRQEIMEQRIRNLRQSN